jgi:hypothetical protein
MPNQIQFRRGNSSQNNNFKGSAGELSVNTDTNSLRVHNGITTGGFELARADLSNVTTSVSSSQWINTASGIYTGANVGIGTNIPQHNLHVVGSGTTALFVDGNARITGILTVGNSSITIDGNNNDIVIGSGVTVYGSTGIISATSIYVGGLDITSLSSSPSRTTVSGSTTSIVANGIGNTNITGFKTYGILKVGLSTAGWLRLYTDSTSRTRDASRSIGIDPTPGSGVILEVVTTGVSTSQNMAPFTIGSNMDEPAQETIYASVTNLSGITTSISINLTIIKMEG